MKICGIDFDKEMRSDGTSLDKTIRMYELKIEFLRKCSRKQLIDADTKMLFSTEYCPVCLETVGKGLSFYPGYNCSICVLRTDKVKHCRDTPWDKLISYIADICNDDLYLTKKRRSKLVELCEEEVKFLQSYK